MSDIVFVIVTRIPGFEDEYGISKDGDIYSYRLKRFLKIFLDRHGYYRVNLRKDEKQCQKFLHRLLADTYISNLDNHPFIDHIDRDTKNNSLSNLRWVTNQENMMNKTKQNNTSSLYKGVYWHKQNKKWQSNIKFNGKSIYLGLFNSEEAAARKYDQKAIELFGEFASINNI